MVEVRRVRKRGQKQILTTPVVQEEEPKQVVISKEKTESEESQNRLAREAIRQNQGNFTTAKGVNEISAELFQAFDAFPCLASLSRILSIASATSGVFEEICVAAPCLNRKSQ